MSDTLRPTFQSPYEQYRERVGQEFTVVRSVDPNDPSLAYRADSDVNDVGSLFLIRFADGVEIQAWPEEIFTGISTFEPDDNHNTKEEADV